MARVSIEIPEDLKALAQRRADEAGHANLEQYIESLIRADAADAADLGGPAHPSFDSDEELEALLARRDHDEPSIEATPEFWEQLRRRARYGPNGGPVAP